MPEYVRVKDKSTGHHYSVLAQVAENDPENYQVLKQPAVNANGDPLPGEIPSETTAPKAAKKTTAKRAAAKKTATAAPVPEKTEES